MRPTISAPHSGCSRIRRRSSSVSRSGLARMCARQAQLADVVEQRAELHLDQLRAGQPQPLAHDRRGGRDLERVAVGVAIRLGQRLHERANLSLGVARAQFPVLVMAQGFAREHAELTQQLHFSRFELSLLVPAADAQCTAFLKPLEEGRGGHRAESGGVQALPDQVGIGTGSGHRDEAAASPGARTTTHAWSKPSTAHAWCASRSSTTLE